MYFNKFWYTEIFQKFERVRGVLQRISGNASEREAHDALHSAACRDQKIHDEICLGLLANILTDANAASKVGIFILVAKKNRRIII